MAILGKIRKSSSILILLIGLALFAFIIQGLIKNSGSLFRPSRDYVGKVNGEPIPTLEFQQRMSDLQKQYGPRYPHSLLMRNVWDQFVNQKLLESEYKKAGILVPKDRIYNMMKNDPGLRRMFTNKQGVFDENAFINYLDNINASKEENPKAYEAWRKYQEGLKETAGRQIFGALVRSALQPSLNEGKWEYHRQNDRVDFDFVVVPYSQIPDSLFKITTQDVENYIKKHKDLYQTKASRDFSYVKFDFKPSKSDYRAVENKLNELINGWVEYNKKTDKNDTVPGFKNTPDVEAFVNKYSDQVLPVRWYGEKSLPADVKDTLLKLPKGGVYGPVLRKNAYYVYRILDKKEVPAKATASHILIAFKGAVPGVTRSEAEAKKLADSLYAVLKRKPAKFKEFVEKYTDDQGSKTKGGTYKDFPFEQMVEPFSEYVFTHKKGSLGLVKTRFGYHIIRVDDLSKDKQTVVKLAQLVKEVNPSEETLDSIYTQAAQFQLKAKKAGDLVKAAKEAGKVVMPVKKVHRFETNLPGLGDQPAIVRWLYNDKTEKGDIKRFEVKDGYVIAQYTNATPEGLMPVSEAMVLVKPILLRQKKFDYVKDKLTGKDLNEIAKKSGGQHGTVHDAGLDSPYIPGLGKEPKVVAVALVVPLNKISKPVKGEYGAYVVKPTKKTIAPDVKTYASFVLQVKQREEKNAVKNILEGLKKNAKIKDNRKILGY